MSDSFWFLPDDGPESDAERPDLAGLPFDSRDAFEPFQEPMKGNRSRPQRAPSTDQKRVRRQIHRSGGYIGRHDQVNWDREYPRIRQHAENGELHRGLGLDLPDELHQYVHDASQPVHERARALLDHIAGEAAREYSGDTERLGLGMHWSMDRGQAQQFAHENGPLHAADNFRAHTSDDGNLHDFTYGVREGDVDADKLAEHLHTEHKVPYHEQQQATPYSDLRTEYLHALHRNVHRKPMPGQAELFPIERGQRNPYVQDPHIDRAREMRGPDVGRARPATEIVLSTPVPPRHLIDEDPETNPNAGGEVFHPFQGGEYEVPLRRGAKIPLSQISWTEVRHGPDDEGERVRWTHHRFGQPEHREAVRHTAMGPAFDEVNWDEIHPKLKDMADNGELHRGIGVNLPDELHRYIHDPSQPQHERAHALLNHIAGMNGREMGDHRLGLGMHWSLSNGVAEGFADAQADHYADANKDDANGDGEDTAHDFSWGKVRGDVDMSEVQKHLHEHHGVHPFQQPVSHQGVQDLHTMLHRGAPPMPGQQALFPEPPRVPKANQHVDLDEFREPDEPRGKPGTEIVLHTPIPSREDIEEHPQGNPNAGGDVYHPLNHGEAEVPIRSGASLPITGVSWREHPHWADTVGEKDPEYVHHRFDDRTTPSHEARKHATVLNTQIERLNKGDQIRTPTGQTSVVQGLRPHETDSTKMYLDTDQGTSLVNRGTDFQVVPQNSQQQELPDTGNPMGSGNTGQLPGSGRTPGGSGVMPQTAPGTCPNCGNTGTLHLQGGNYVCSVCGFTVPAGGTPGGLTFTNQPSGAMPARRKPGEVPRAHVWASKYVTSNDSRSQIARRARRVSGGDQ